MAGTVQSLTVQEALDSDDEELSPEQIQHLLQEAETRLHKKAALQKTQDLNVTLPKLSTGTSVQPYIKTNGTVARLDPAQLDKEASHRQARNRIRRIDDAVAVKQDKDKAKKASAGPDWYNMPRTDLTPALKRDLQLLKMRNVLDPHRHYKKDNSKSLAPEYSQVGTIVEGPTEFFSARINNRDRKETLADEILAGEQSSGRFRKKYDEIQVKKTSGKKAHYKALMAKRKRSFKR